MNLIENKKEFTIYSTPNGKVKIEVVIFQNSIWLSQKMIAELFGVDRSVITKHLNNIYKDFELIKDSTSAFFAQVQNEGSRTITRNVEFYNLDAIISVGYRVNSIQATNFRIWATNVLKEYIIKGFTIDDERLKNGKYFDKDYFQELLERVRSIRASERRIYQKITDTFAECCVDYDKNSDITKEFYSMVQNKFHFAITGKTAAEIIYDNADRNNINMGLKTWKNSPDKRILKSDTVIAKNYLEEQEIKRLERMISGYFDYLERVIENHVSLNMQKMAESINKFLEFNEYKILEDKGKISHKKAVEKAYLEYDEFNKTQKIESDFDKEIKKLLDNK